MLTRDFEGHHPRLAKLVFGNVHGHTLFTGCRFAEVQSPVAINKSLIFGVGSGGGRGYLIVGRRRAP